MRMIPDTWLYRHDEIECPRPYGIDVDDDGWLWEGCGPDRLVAHNLRTAELRIAHLPQMDGGSVYQAFAWQGKLLLTLGHGSHYLVYDPQSGECARHAIPGSSPIVWYGTRTPNDKLLLYERSESSVLVLDRPDAEPRVVACPFQGQLASGTPFSDGLVYSSLTDPCRIIRFDPVTERFIDETTGPHAEAGLSGSFEHDGTVYAADSAGGRLLALDMASMQWQDPIPTPDHGEVYGFIGAGFGMGSRGYFCLSSYAFQSRLDPTTGKIITPEGWDVGVDGHFPRFLQHYLVFDAETRGFGYLTAPEQPDGIPLLCYSWTDGERFAITGIVIPFARPGEPGAAFGSWIVLQSQEAEDESPLDPSSVLSQWDRDAHIRQYRRGYSRGRSLYLPEPQHSPAPVNLSGPAASYSPGRDAELARRAARTDAKAYWAVIAESVCGDLEPPAEKARAIGGFVQRSLYYNPTQVPTVGDPIAVLASHDARCGQGVAITCAILEAAGVECRQTGVNHHVVTEVRYDDAWHLLDALFFGEDQPTRDGQVVSVEQLQADPYFADAWPQPCFAYDPELLTSEDGYQVLGYVFGIWGSEPYYSNYMGGEYDCPPTLPSLLPVQRLGGSKVSLRWGESVKMGGGEIEYDVRVFADRECSEEVFRTATAETRAIFCVPEPNRMYIVEVRAIDQHRERNSDTWYPPARWDFVLAPEEQYGWYGVM